jgi:hypothetical protein
LTKDSREAAGLEKYATFSRQRKKQIEEFGLKNPPGSALHEPGFFAVAWAPHAAGAWIL